MGQLGIGDGVGLLNLKGENSHSSVGDLEPVVVQAILFVLGLSLEG